MEGFLGCAFTFSRADACTFLLVARGVIVGVGDEDLNRDVLLCAPKYIGSAVESYGLSLIFDTASWDKDDPFPNLLPSACECPSFAERKDNMCKHIALLLIRLARRDIDVQWVCARGGSGKTDIDNVDVHNDKSKHRICTERLCY